MRHVRLFFSGLTILLAALVIAIAIAEGVVALMILVTSFPVPTMIILTFIFIYLLGQLREALE